MNFIPKNEIFRKILHILSTCIPLSYLWIVRDKDIVTHILGILTIAVYCFDLLRTSIPKIKIYFDLYFGSMLRDYELNGNLTGATYLLFGYLLTVLLFPMEIAVCAMIILSVGDSFAAIVGKSFPIWNIGGKTLSGTLSGIFVSFLFSSFVLPGLPIMVILVGAVFGMVVELFSNRLNDNFLIPVLSGLIMFIMEQNL